MADRSLARHCRNWPRMDGAGPTWQKVGALAGQARHMGLGADGLRYAAWAQAGCDAWQALGPLLRFLVEDMPGPRAFTETLCRGPQLGRQRPRDGHSGSEISPSGHGTLLDTTFASVLHNFTLRALRQAALPSAIVSLLERLHASRCNIVELGGMSCYSGASPLALPRASLSGSLSVIVLDSLLGAFDAVIGQRGLLLGLLFACAGDLATALEARGCCGDVCRFSPMQRSRRDCGCRQGGR